MMLGSVFAKTLRDNRRTLFWWSLGLAFYVLLNLAFYPDFKDQTEFNNLLEGSEAIKAVAPNVTSFTAPEGYLNSQMYSVVIPMMLAFFAIFQGAGAIAGEEGRRTLSLLLANPVRREKVVLQKAGAVLLGLAIVITVALTVLAVAAPIFELNIGLDKFLALHLSMGLLAAMFGALGLLIGAATGNKALAAAISGSLAVGSYLIYSLVPLASSLEPYEQFSPFYYYLHGDPLSKGLDVSDAGVLLVATVLLVGFAVLAFRRRDIATS